MAKGLNQMSQQDNLTSIWPMLAKGRGTEHTMSTIGLSAQSAMAAKAVKWYETERPKEPAAVLKEALAATAMLAERLTQLADRLANNGQEAAVVRELATYLMRVAGQANQEMMAMPSGYSEVLAELSDNTLAKTNTKLVR